MNRTARQLAVVAILFIFTALFAVGLALLSYDPCDENCERATQFMEDLLLTPGMSTIIPASETALSRTATSAAATQASQAD